ncbi:cobalt-precorrin-4/precorrin-4 C(11)-methyltransferase [Lentzea aerocolonigenes]|uniref:cobalt-precorrin-4/precorrin-4 C(11)-methyltransferase n=1 Tax=Lentzea aerocolonigenes TaxID=68170 RepID=UPI000566D62C|nr:cobalt-precorrin-4/precorrin-4 C(11)-methyltransferase [Lentzea aerocolonigenes]MCP2250135.1 precorrin-4/cobalt-precorrin-4 C11-methyltransferase [Lentzea aerocolonigenes]
MTTTGRVSFVGAGPGAADLITLRGARRIAEADVVVWAPSAVDAECVREHARADAELVDFSRVTQEEITDLYRRAAASRLTVVRLHAGDAATGGGVQEQHDLCLRLGLEVEVVPGVSVVAAAAAKIGREITLTEASSTVLISPESSELVQEFAALQTTMAATVSGARTGQFVEKLLQGGYSETTPVVVAYKVSQADELVVHTTIGELEAVVKKHKLYRPTLFLVGSAVKAPTRRVSTSATTSVDEPIRAARPTRWSRRAASRISTRVDEPVPAAPVPAAAPAEPNPAWTAVEEIQQSVRKPAEEPAPKPKLTVVAAEKPKPPTVRASTATPKKKPAARKPKRTS